jgi:type II secretory pathway pseudopilin PulG
MSLRPRSEQPQAGITLIEIIVVMGLMALMFAVAAPSLSAVLGADKRRASSELAATLRAVYEESVVRNMPMRVAYDLDGRNYWVEASDSAVIFRDRTQAEAFEEFMAEKAESDVRAAEKAKYDTSGGLFGGGGGGLGDLLAGFFGGGGGGGADGSTGSEYRPNEFVLVEDGIFRKRNLPRGVHFWGVWTPQYEDPVQPLGQIELEAMMEEAPEDQKWTIAYTHVFPGGYMEDTVVYLTDSKGEDVTSLVVEPLMGRVKIVQDYVTPPDTSDREDD